jgi:hypothetical protein
MPTSAVCGDIDEAFLEHEWSRQATTEVLKHFKVPKDITADDRRDLQVYIWGDLYPDGSLHNLSSANHRWAKGKISIKKRVEIEQAMRNALINSSVNFARPKRIKIWGICFFYAPTLRISEEVSLVFRNKSDL